MESRRTRKRADQTTVVFPNPTANSSTPAFGLGARLILSDSENSLSPISQSSNASPASYKSHQSQSNASHTSSASHTSTLSFMNMQNQPKSKNQSTIVMICKAIEALASGKAGSSVPAIKKWILGNYTNMTESLLKRNLKKALLKGLEDGTLVRPPRSKSIPGATGSFCLPPKKAVKNANRIKKTTNPNTKTKKVSKEKPEEYVSDSEMTINRNRKSIRQNMSDTELDVVRKSIVFEEKPKRMRKAVPSKQKISKDNSEESEAESKKSESKSKANKPSAKHSEEKAAPAKPLRKTRNTDSANKENTAPIKVKVKVTATKPAKVSNTKDAEVAVTKQAKAVNKKEAEVAAAKQAKAANAKEAKANHDKKQAPKRNLRK